MNKRDFLRRALQLGAGAAGAVLLPRMPQAGQVLYPPYLFDSITRTWWRFVEGQGYHLLQP